MIDKLKPREVEMLQMLKDGACSKEIARRFDVSPGSARQYLCKLYEKLKVKNRVDAVVWFINNRVGEESLQRVRYTEEVFGKTALEHGLLEALGPMGTYIGEAPFRNPLLWEWLLAADFKAAAEYYRNNHHRFTSEATPTDISVMATLLLMGTETDSGTHLTQCLDKINARYEFEVVDSLRAQICDKSTNARLRLFHLTTTVAVCHPTKHLAMVALFYLYRQEGEFELACSTAKEILEEAHTFRNYLKAPRTTTTTSIQVISTPPKTEQSS